ncbi:DUF401 family protein [uncultured Ilyobacter sp.]|uniref:DUF401 family protein n=1 Tax=uncultured Ilyobacter sp. TaxID=544433 RepID=UPI0029F5C988|nr:DUF401 family protein [uncultured Ilyobacter sp.]
MVLVKLILSILIILYLVNRKINIGYSLMIGGIALGLFTGRSLVHIFGLIIEAVSDYQTLSLALAIGLITVMGHLMDKYYLMERMIGALEKMLRSAKATIMFAPVIIGTLLVSGGALMSCPVVDNLGEKMNISQEKKASINMIFRHGLYFIFPLSPTIVMAAEIGGYEVNDFIFLMLPIGILFYIIAYTFYFRNVKSPEIENVDMKEYLTSIKGFLIYSSPILVSLMGVLLINLEFYISLILGIVLCFVINKIDKRKDSKFNLKENILMTMLKGVKVPLVISIFGIMVYKNIVNDVNEINELLKNMLEFGIPIELVVFLSAALISYALGSTNPSVAILFPMILPLAPDYDTRLLYAMFIYTTAFMFYFISPLHLCQVVTFDYFKVKMKGVFKNYIYILPVTYLAMVIIYSVKIK